MEHALASNKFDIVEQIKNFKNSLQGTDSVKARIHKHLAHSPATPVSHFTNLSIEKGSPVYKAKSRVLIYNYQAVSVLPVIFKIYETVSHSHGFSYLDQRSILCSYQFSYKLTQWNQHS